LGEQGMAAVLPQWLPIILGLCRRTLPAAVPPIFLPHLPEDVYDLWSSHRESLFAVQMALLAWTA